MNNLPLSGAVLLATLSFSQVLSAPLARLEPARGVIAGVNLGWGGETVAAFNERTGWKHACYVDFSVFPKPGGYITLNSHVRQVAEVGGIFLITLEPEHGLASIQEADVDVFVAWCAGWAEKGASIMVRFAHEMNGAWYPWSMRPALYREKFRLLAERLHARLPDAAMLWAPNEAGYYPFGHFREMTRAAYLDGGHGTEADWTLLDTNGDGVLLQDDPYAPFYPGDDAVDWVGMTVYHWGTAYPWHFNTLPEADKFAQVLTGTYNGSNGDQTWAPDFYAEWAEGHGKPMMIPETGALFRPGIASNAPSAWPPQQTHDEVAIKTAWMEQVYSAEQLAARFPRLKGINWFNHYKRENEAQQDLVDWTVTRQPVVLSSYQATLRQQVNDVPAFLDVNAWRAACSSKSAVRVSPEPPLEPLPVTVPATDPGFRFIGRWELGEGGYPRAAWTMAGVAFRAEASDINLLVEDAPAWPSRAKPEAGNVVRVVVDGVQTSVVTLAPAQLRYPVARGLPAGPHAVEVHKRTEAHCGELAWVGVELSEGGRLLEAPPAPARKILFIGDSVTAGYGNEAAGKEEKYHPSTVNGTRAFAALAAAELGAEPHVIAWSGKGVWRNADGSLRGTMPALCERALPARAGSLWPADAWRPDVVVITLGVNDFGPGTPPRPAFELAYSNLVQRVGETYGWPPILCCESATPNDDWPAGQQRRSTLRAWLSGIAASFQTAGRDKVQFHEFAQQREEDGFGADHHPSLVTHQRMATQLTARLRELGWME